jgi:hypothetical protein
MRENALRPDPVELLPTIWPKLFIALAVLDEPPNVPRSTIPSAAVHEKAWVLNPAV